LAPLISNGFSGDFRESDGCWKLGLERDGKITLWQCNSAIENGTFIVDLPIENGDFP